MKGKILEKDGVEYELLQSPRLTEDGKDYEASAITDHNEIVTILWSRDALEVDCDWHDFEVY